MFVDVQVNVRVRATLSRLSCAIAGRVQRHLKAKWLSVGLDRRYRNCPAQQAFEGVVECAGTASGVTVDSATGCLGIAFVGT